MRKTYKNLPLSPTTYAKVAMIADGNGLGLGAQVEKWVEKELPECGHKKQAVTIEYFSTDLLTGSARQVQSAYYCHLCQRVYARVEEGNAGQETHVERALRALRKSKSVAVETAG